MCSCGDIYMNEHVLHYVTPILYCIVGTADQVASNSSDHPHFGVLHAHNIHSYIIPVT